MSLVETPAASGNGLDEVRALMADGIRAPITELLDFRLIEAENGRVVFEGTPSEKVYNPIGSVHGGYAATLLDSACGIAVHTKLSPAQGYTTLELKVAYHKAMTSQTGPVRAEGKVITFGRRAAFAEARITDATGRLYASATSTLLVFDK